MEGQKGKKSLVVGLIVGIIVLAILALIAAAATGAITLGGLSAKDAAVKAEKFINTELLGGQGDAIIKVVGEEGGLYKLEVSYQGQKIDSYMTKDGKFFFPSVYDMASTTAPAAADSPAAAAAEAPKNDKPIVELFVMSYCPYGTQIEKGIIPVVQALGNKIDFKLKFVDYTMHGDKENQENLREYCIDQGQNNKLLGYLSCFLKSGDSTACLKSTGVDEAKVQTCMDSTAKTEQITGTDFSVHQADNQKYGVQGSPTLVINGTTVQSARDSASLLKTICGAFSSAPSECDQKLSTASPSAGFGEGTDSSATDASCE
ncbi:MAG: hypothetical protein WC517_01280 [Patescibacteria group bacterium]